MRKLLILGLLVLLVTISFFYADLDLTENKIESYVYDSGDIEVYFCPQDNCEEVLIDFLSSAEKSLHCTIFDVGLHSVKEVLLKKSKEIDVKVVTDNGYLKKFDYPFVKVDTWGLMHNKFCVIDGEKLFTGSMNPTGNGVDKNNNNLLLINSPVLAGNYESEFIEMWNGEFKGGGKVLNPKIKLGEVVLENYFCPEDSCAFHVKEELKKAESSIYFMTFSFTHEGIANVLLLKNMDGLEVKGVMEARQVTKYSQYKRLLNNGVDVVKDKNKQNMHHKVFIIDEKTVVTGSFNPTNGGDSKNDENILIIRDVGIAKQFKGEFDRVCDELREQKIT